MRPFGVGLLTVRCGRNTSQVGCGSKRVEKVSAGPARCAARCPAQTARSASAGILIDFGSGIVFQREGITGRERIVLIPSPAPDCRGCAALPYECVSISPSLFEVVSRPLIMLVGGMTGFHAGFATVFAGNERGFVKSAKSSSTHWPVRELSFCVTSVDKLLVQLQPAYGATRPAASRACCGGR